MLLGEVNVLSGIFPLLILLTFSDINRTFPENIYFANERDPAGLQRPLKHVLMAFALNNPHVGYCQVHIATASCVHKTINMFLISARSFMCMIGVL